MANETFFSPKITPPPVQDRNTARAFAHLTQQIEFRFTRILERLDEQRGTRGTPTVLKPMNFNGNRAMHLGKPTAPDDAQQFGLCLHADEFDGPFNAAGRTITNVAPAVNDNEAVIRQQLNDRIAALGQTFAPTSAEYIVAVADANLTAERVATNTATVTWDFGTAAQAKANVAQLDTGWNVTNVTPDKSYDADATTLAEIADVLGTLIDLLKTKGILGA